MSIRMRAKEQGGLVTVKALVKHPMETGQRKDKNGEKIPQKIINRFEASYNGAAVVSVDIAGAVSTNPFFEFAMKVSESGDLAFKWHDDDGSVYETSKSIAVG